jgi:hypothetical protein
MHEITGVCNEILSKSTGTGVIDLDNAPSQVVEVPDDQIFDHYHFRKYAEGLTHHDEVV